MIDVLVWSKSGEVQSVQIYNWKIGSLNFDRYEGV